jgi:hypothetical protein
MTPKEMQKTLEDFGFDAPGMKPWMLRVMSVAGAVVGVAVILVGVASDKTTEGAAAATAVVFAIVGLWQWRSGRHEASLDRFYERLALANELVLEAYESAARARQAGAGDALATKVAENVFRYYVYTEMDNLEYAIEKYRKGFMDERLAFRALRSFQDRCKNRKLAVSPKELEKEFAEIVRRILKDATRTGKDGFSYNELTLKVVRAIIEAG